MKLLIDIPDKDYDEEIIAETVESIWGKPPYTELLDKIRAEIEDIYCGQYCDNPLTADTVKERVLEIIDKYKEN